jgi:hypothetical protein
MSQLALPLCQRWNRGRTSYRPPGETIDTTKHGVEVIETSTAKAFVKEHHYSGSFPSAIFRVGLYRVRPFQRPALVGAAVFSVPTHQGVVPHWTGLPAERGCLLGRFVLTDEVEALGETFTLGRAFAALRKAKPHIETVIAYSDPVPRRQPDGSLLSPGHFGLIYAAFNGYYLGRGRARTLIVTQSGVVLNERSLSKLRNDERGRDAVERELRRLGAPPRHRHESGAAYLMRALREGPFDKKPHPGCHVYAWPIGHAGRRLRPILEAKALPRPLKPDPFPL